MDDAGAISEASAWLGIFRLRPDLLEYDAWTDEERAVVGAHFERLKTEADAGHVVIAGRTAEHDESGNLDESTIGIVVFLAKERSEAEAFMEADPAVVAGIMTQTVQRYRIAVLCDKLAFV